MLPEEEVLETILEVSSRDEAGIVADDGLRELLLLLLVLVLCTTGGVSPAAACFCRFIRRISSKGNTRISSEAGATAADSAGFDGGGG